MTSAGYLSGNVGYEVGENIAWGTLEPRDTREHRQRLDELARPPREHPARRVPPDRHRRQRGRARAGWPRAKPGATYTQDFGVITG